VTSRTKSHRGGNHVLRCSRAMLTDAHGCSQMRGMLVAGLLPPASTLNTFRPWTRCLVPGAM
jgi:hypothetical protein